MKRLYQAVARVRADDAAERCELCALPLAARHDHLFDPVRRELRCACEGCALIVPTSEKSPYRRVPRRFERAPLGETDAAAWLARLGVPVGVAVVTLRDDGRATVGYPGPAGLVEAELEAAVTAELRAALPALAPEIEAIVWSTIGKRGDAWLAGIDVVFELVGELRRSWRGLTGGAEAPAAIARVLAQHAESAA